jgi:polyhydroxybutyrate depolymerase
MRFIVLLSVFAIVLVIAGCPARESKSADRAIDHEGLERSYRIYVPVSITENEQVPLILVLHGAGGSGASMERTTGLSTIAEREGFIVAYPEADERFWNDHDDLEDPNSSSPDDVGYLRAVIEKITREYPVDPQRVFAAGLSNGGLMCHRLACEAPDLVAGVAGVASQLTVPTENRCSTTAPVPILLINGTEDPIVRFDDTSTQGGHLDPESVLSARETVESWALHNRAALNPDVTFLPDVDPEDGTRVTREVYPGKADGAPVWFYVVEGGGHSWPGGRVLFRNPFDAPTSNDVSASELITEFFLSQ